MMEVTKVYCYYVRRPHIPKDVVARLDAAFEAAAAYDEAAKRIQIWRPYRTDRALAEVDAAFAQVCDQIKPIRAELRELWERAKLVRRDRREEEIPDVMAAIERCQTTLRPLWKQLNELRKTASKSEAGKAALEVVHNEYRARVRALYAQHDRVTWQTKNSIQASAEQAYQSLFKPGQRRRIQLRPYEGYGRLGGQCTWQFVRPEPPSRQQHSKRKRTLAVKGLLPKEVVELPIVYSREIPEGDVKRVTLHRTVTDGSRIDYEVQITVTHEDTRVRPTSDALLAIDVGWRRLDDGTLRVGYWAGSDGAEGELHIPTSALVKRAKSTELQSLRDKLTNDVWTALGRTGDPDPRALYQLAREGDATATAWAKKDRHLLHWQTGDRTTALSIRDEAFRLFVAEMSKRYSAVALEGEDHKSECDGESTQLMDLRRFAEDGKAAPGQRFFARLSTLRTLLANAMLVVPVETANTTREHYGCGGTMQGGSKLMLTCDRCGEVEDCDRNAARNILARGLVRRDGAAKLAHAKTQHAVDKRLKRQTARAATMGKKISQDKPPPPPLAK